MNQEKERTTRKSNLNEQNENVVTLLTCFVIRVLKKIEDSLDTTVFGWIDKLKAEKFIKSIFN